MSDAKTISAPPSPQTAVSRYRWVICGLLFVATTVNYIDRSVISVVKPELEAKLGWTQIDYSNIVICFQLAYAIGLLIMGRVIDRIGVRRGFALAAILWGTASVAHGFVAYIPRGDVLWTIPASVLAFSVCRFALGLAEAGNFPACIKTVGEWFPKKERALATGLFNSGANIGAVVAPVLVGWVVMHWDWGKAFFTTGILDALWVIAWLVMYRNVEDHPRVSAAELAYIRNDPVEPAPPKIPWVNLLGYRQTWAFTIGKFLTDPIWWMYLFWVPDFLNKRHGLDIKHFGPPLVTIYTMTCFGSIAGGWLSSKLIRSGRTVNFSRKMALLVCGLCVVPIIAVTQVSNLWVAVVLIGIAASAHAGWSANIFTLVSDTVPKQAISSVTGIGGMAGALGGMFIAKLIGYVLDKTHNNYFIPFAIASVSYLLALAIMHALNPKLEPMKFAAESKT